MVQRTTFLVSENNNVSEWDVPITTGIHKWLAKGYKKFDIIKIGSNKIKHYEVVS